MKIEIVQTCKWNRTIVKMTDKYGITRYRIKQGRTYIGKLKDGGYITKQAAVKRAEATLS